MAAPFVWFDNLGTAPDATADFLRSMFDWKPQTAGPRTFLGQEGAEMPFALTADSFAETNGWVPYVQVTDLEAETTRARDLGAQVLAENIKGPAGIATFLKDPGGATNAIWVGDAA